MTLPHNLAFNPVRFTLWTMRDKAALRRLTRTLGIE
jgi:hypothetical protein